MHPAEDNTPVGEGHQPAHGVDVVGRVENHVDGLENGIGYISYMHGVDPCVVGIGLESKLGFVDSKSTEFVCHG